MKYIANPVEVDAAIIKEIGPIDESGGCWLTVGDMDYVADNGFFATKEMLSRIESAMDYRLRADLLGRVVLFLGYSFRDTNVSYLFRRINALFQNLPGSPTGRRAYITVADPSDFETELFRARNIEVIPIDGREQTADIASLLETMKR